MTGKFILSNVLYGPRLTPQRYSPLSWLARRYDLYLQRADLAELDDRMLADLGLSREDVRRECAKPIWRP